MKFIITFLSISSILTISAQPAQAIIETLYDGVGLPENNSPQWLIPGAIQSTGFPTTISATSVSGGVQIDSNGNNAEYAGYSNYNAFTSSFINSNFPTLDQASGYNIFLNVALDTTNDFSDTNSNNRAAFSIIVIGKNNEGIEIGFDDGQIFAQSSDFQQVADETQSFTTSNSTNYQIAVTNAGYQLLANTGSGFTSVISGALRTYNFNPATSNPPLGTFNPYEIPNFLFLGDDTGQAHGTFTLGEVSVEIAAVPFNFSPTLGLIISGVGLLFRRQLSKNR